MVIFVILLLGLGGVIAYMYLGGGDADAFIETNLLDSNGNPVENGISQSVVNGIEGVAFASFDVNIENLDTVDLVFKLTSITPASVSSSLPTNTITIEPGQTGKFTTELIDIQQFEGNVQEFCITAESEPIPALREKGVKSGCVSLDIQPNPEGNFNVNVDSDLEEPGVNPSCTENWQCSSWSSCSDNLQTRDCVDLNNCGTTDNLPSGEQFCESESSQFETNAQNGNYNVQGVWIIVNDIQYFRDLVSSYTCSAPGASVILTTPEGNEICSRNGYDPSDRLYLQMGSQSVVFSS